MTWISCKDQMPSRNERVLVFHVVERRAELAELNCCEQWDYGDNYALGDTEEVSHWMPLPKAPE